MGRETKHITRRTVLKGFGAAAGLPAAHVASAVVFPPSWAAAQGTTEASGGEPQPGGTLIVAIPQSVGVLNPVDRAAGGPLSFVIQQMFEGPLRSVAASPELEPGFAEAVDVSPDGLEYTIHFRPNLTFHDGTPLDAAAYKFSLEMVLNQDHPYHRDTYVPWEDRFPGSLAIEEVDPRTLKLILSQPVVNLDYELASLNFMAVNPTVVQADPENWGRNPVGAGSGPFMLEDFVPDQTVSYRRFAEYWEADKPYLDRLIVQTLPDFGSRLLALSSGEIHVMPVQGGEVEEAERDPNVQIIAGEHAHVHFLLFDHADPIVGQREVRQAISHAIDRETLVRELLPNSIVAQSLGTMPGMEGRREDIQGYPYDPEQAQELLAAAGYPDGIDVTLTYSRTFPTPDTTFLVQAIQAQVARVGIRMSLQEVDTGALFQAVYPDVVHEDFPYQMALAAIGSRGDTQRSVFNWTYLSNYAGLHPEYVEIVEAASREPDREERLALWGRAQQMLSDDVAAVPIDYEATTLAARKEVQGLKAPFSVFPIYYKDVWLA